MLSLLAFAAASFSWLRLAYRSGALQGSVDGLLAYALLLPGQIVLSGYLLSALTRLSSMEAWLMASFIWLLAAGLVSRLRLVKPRLREGFSELWGSLIGLFGEATAWQKALLLSMTFTAALTGLLNLGQVIFAAPFNWDSLTYHLARVAYYLQYSSLRYYAANNWAQVIHPKLSPVLMLYAYLAGGRNEDLTGLVQFAAYWTGMFAVYGVARRSGFQRPAALFSGLVFALLTEALMQSITTQNDLLLATLFGISLYFLLSYHQTSHLPYLVWSGAALGMAAAVKMNFVLVLPALGMMAGFAILRPVPRRNTGVLSPLRTLWKPAILYGLACCAGLAVFALPGGYAENMARFGHPFGPPFVRRSHSFEGQPGGFVMVEGLKNAARYTIDFASLDGLPPVTFVRSMQSAMRGLPETVLDRLGVDLQAGDSTRPRFSYRKSPAAQEDESSWGLPGILLIWPAVLLSLVKYRRNRLILSALTLSVLVFVASQAFSSYYDPWRGRYFLALAPFAAPLAARWLAPKPSRALRLYLAAAVLLTCLSALSAVLFRKNSALIPVSPNVMVVKSVVGLDRIGQLTRNNPIYDPALRLYEAEVPRNATVAVAFGNAAYEYPLFGEGLTRTLIPVNPFWGAKKPVPPQADYLVFSDSVLPAQPGDLLLGEVVAGRWYLRCLRQCK